MKIFEYISEDKLSELIKDEKGSGIFREWACFAFELERDNQCLKSIFILFNELKDTEKTKNRIIWHLDRLINCLSTESKIRFKSNMPS